MEIRTLTAGDVDAVFELSGQAFNMRGGDEERARAARRFQPERGVGAFVDGRLVAKVVVHPMAQWFGGRVVPMGGVAGVTVYPEHRAQGLTTRLIDIALTEMRDRGEVFSSLYPATGVPYRRTGWEVAGTRQRRTVPLRTLAALPRPAEARTITRHTDADLPAVRRVYDRVAATCDGYLARDDWGWRRVLDNLEAADHGYLYVARDPSGDATGYLTYTHREPHDDDEFYGLRVHDLLALDGDTTLALWRLLGSNRGVSLKVDYYAGVDEPLDLLTAEQDRVTDEDWRWMSRLVDAPGAIAARGFPPGVDATVPFEIADAHAPWNAGRWVLEVRDGKGVLTPGGDGRVRATINALAPLYTGLTTAWQLARHGLLVGATDEDLDALGRAFAGPPPSMLDFF